MEKECFKCQTVKPLSGFYTHAKMADGYLNKCAECCRKDARANANGKRPQIREYESRRALLEHRVAARRRYRVDNAERIQKLTREWQERNPQKRAAHVLLNNCLKSGRIKKPPCCDVCQKAVAVQGHHEDYTKPLWAAWLCARCHRLVHKGVVTLGRFHNERTTG